MPSASGRTSKPAKRILSGSQDCASGSWAITDLLGPTAYVTKRKAPHRLWSLDRMYRSYVSKRSSGLHRLSKSRLSSFGDPPSCVRERDLLAVVQVVPGGVIVLASILINTLDFVHPPLSVKR